MRGSRDEAKPIAVLARCRASEPEHMGADAAVDGEGNPRTQHT